jgi:formylglycine-generating enzyme required for sulfatase activity
VTNVSWLEVEVFLKQLKRLTGKLYRLPTEAEWEYAARGGQTGDGYDGLVDYYAWHNENSNLIVHPVKQKLPNGLGLYDMLGNVWEWCSDWYGPYTSDPKKDPKGPEFGSFRVYRGGCWGGNPRGCRVSLRDSATPVLRDSYLGLRLASQ